MGFVRFVINTCHPDFGFDEGLFRLAYELRDDARLDDSDALHAGAAKGLIGFLEQSEAKRSL